MSFVNKAIIMKTSFKCLFQTEGGSCRPVALPNPGRSRGVTASGPAIELPN